jgi:molybdenum cofactor cytidylyltransferase
MTPPCKIAVLFLAAGLSRRFGDSDKLLADCGASGTLIDSALAPYQEAPWLSQKIAVTSPHSQVSASCLAAGFEICINPQPENGMGGSIACGMAVLQNASHVLIGLADMPRLQSSTLEKIYHAIDHAGASIVLPSHAGTRGHPRLFAARHFAALAQLKMDTGGRSIIAACPTVADVAVDDAGCLFDVDTRQDLTASQAAW